MGEKNSNGAHQIKSKVGELQRLPRIENVSLNLETAISDAIDHKMPELLSSPPPVHIHQKQECIQWQSDVPSPNRHSTGVDSGTANPIFTNPFLDKTHSADLPSLSTSTDGKNNQKAQTIRSPPPASVTGQSHKVATGNSDGRLLDGELTTTRNQASLKNGKQLLKIQPTIAETSFAYNEKGKKGEADLRSFFDSILGSNRSGPNDEDHPSTQQFLTAASTLRGLLDAELKAEQRLSNQHRKIEHTMQETSSNDHSGELEGDSSSSAPLRVQKTYLCPRLPLIFAHGLFGFDTISLAPQALSEALPLLTFDYWRGIVDVLQRRGNEVVVARVPMSASTPERASALRDIIEKHFPGREVNLIGHSMGGIDCRYLISHLSGSFTVRSLTTIATPHRGSTFADYMLEEVIGHERLPKLLNLLEKSGLPGGGRAFQCLTTKSMKNFNQETPDKPGVSYSSWGAAFQPGTFNEFRIPHGIIREKEGANDGLVSVSSSKWAKYRGTLHASHLDLIGWTRQFGLLKASATGDQRPFDPKTLYLTICEDLALEGL